MNGRQDRKARVLTLSTSSSDANTQPGAALLHDSCKPQRVTPQFSYLAEGAAVGNGRRGGASQRACGHRRQQDGRAALEHD